MSEKIERILDSESEILEKYTELYETFLKKDIEQNYLNLQAIIEYSDLNMEFDFDELENETKNEIAEVGIKYQTLLKSIVKVITSDNDCPEQFYQKLYNIVFDSELFKLDNRQFGCILLLLSHQIEELPYYQAKNALEMSDEEFGNVIEEIKPKIRKGIYMLRNRFNSFTEQASQLYDIAESLGDRKKAIVFWAAMISRFKDSQSEENM